MEGLHELKSDFTPGCPRCQLPMAIFKDGAWYCEQCLGQFWDKPAPDFHVIKDQMIRSGPRDLMRPDGGFKMLMSAKHKSSGSRKGRHRKKKYPMKKSYYFPDDKGA